LLSGGFSSGAFGVNNAGIVTGRADTTVDFFGYQFNQTHAFRYTRQGGMVDLGSLFANLGLGIDDFVFSTGSAINEQGQIVGRSGTFDSDFNYFEHAFRFTEGVGMVDLGTLSGGIYSDSRAINNRGDVVGVSFSSFPGDAFIFTDASGM